MVIKVFLLRLLTLVLVRDIVRESRVFGFDILFLVGVWLKRLRNVGYLSIDSIGA
jgi:hypothetical protein